MMLASRSSLFAIFTGVSIFVGAAALHDGPDRLAANTVPIQDTDGDLLPDSLEWVLLMMPSVVDTDLDGTDDFIEAVSHELLNGALPLGPRPLDHEMRALVAVHEDQNQIEHVVVHIIVRIASGGAGQVTQLDPFLDFQGTRVPIGELITGGLVHFAVRVDPTEGMLVVMSSRIALASQLAFVLPCTIGVTGTIGQKSLQTETLLVEADGEAAALIPVSEDRFVIQPLNPNANPNPGPNSGFWKQAHVCELELIPAGAGGGSQVCEVADADCTGAPTLRCAPSCQSQSGKVFVVPYGIGALNGK